MKKLFFILITVSLFCMPAFAAEEKVCEVKGQGINREEAIKKALQQAVAQTKGVEISSRDADFIYRSASADIERKDSGGKTVEFDAVSVETGGTALRTDIAGLVKTYEVLDEKKIDDNTYEVTLKVTVFDYTPLDSTSKIKLAVMPIRALKDKYVFGDSLIAWQDIVTQLSHKLSMGLTETGKFAVLDREYVLEFAKERNMLLSDAAPLEEKAKLGKVLGADYMLVGTVTKAQFLKKQKFSSIVGSDIAEYRADFVFGYRIVVCPSMQVKLADEINISLRDEEVQALVKDWDPKDLDYSEIKDNLIAMVANKAVQTIIDRLYPVRIASIEADGRVIINQGGGKIAEGTLLSVFADGKELFDSDTKESLGKTEILVATIKVTEVLPKISYAKVIEGDSAKLTANLVCRIKESLKPVEGKTGSIERNSTGGVKLPFDK